MSLSTVFRSLSARRAASDAGMCPLKPGAFSRRSICSRDLSLNFGRILPSDSVWKSMASAGAHRIASNPKPAEPRVARADLRSTVLFENMPGHDTCQRRVCRRLEAVDGGARQRALARLTGNHAEFFLDGRKALEDFMEAQSHVANRVSLRHDGSGQSGFQQK